MKQCDVAVGGLEKTNIHHVCFYGNFVFIICDVHRVDILVHYVCFYGNSNSSCVLFKVI